ncbi:MULTISPECIES: PAS domain-containing sensor histidine kinase [Methylobacterium]|uniref:histidine kinase n=1 Tax=Methylobacterium fujisawaense TaxID=107400 RepID=A0ABR6DIJ4_9HYPH|nr:MULTISPECIES: PAS domain-containing sensor histidine kinase [Methylobacterium]MBA9065902.1 two-component system cell cycle sensor histidine kinase/response regulator CckA [Methylobacterium fujisawaense]MDE4913039.1 response regulator [Methylobacterium sp. 092160098-2]SFU89324.1 two-component system, cell cycle sensor histidine kinase and response regulator CckA [Methylobacterium sp. UNCCL125]
MADVTGPPAPAAGPQNSGPPVSQASALLGTGSIDRSEQPGRVGLLLVLAGLLVGAAIGLSFVANEQAQSLIVWLLALLAMAGVFFLFALAIGALQLSGSAARDDITKGIVDASPDGKLVVEEGGRLIYANEAYLRIASGDTFSNLVPVERILVGSPEVSEAVYRLSQASRDARAHTEEVRMSPPLGPTVGERGFGWYRVSVRPLARPRRAASLWTVADITAERERQENVFQELQHAIDYLDHAPAGFLSIDPAGAIVYMNATLAAWLGYDLASVGPGGPHLTEIAPEADVLVRTAGLPGEVRTDRFDLDLRRRNGHTLPVRLYHRVAFGKDGKPGSSRTFVINRSAGAETDEPQRAAEVRLARFLNNSPIAIATLDRTGCIARANASFTRLFGTVPRQADDGAFDGDGATRVEPNVADSVADRTALEAGLARAASGRTDPEPIEVQLTGPGGRSARVWLSPADGGDPGQQTDEAERVILYALDTTAQRQLEQQVAQAQKMNAVGQLAGGIAHDFNNVLQAIIGYSDLLLASHRPTDPAFQDIMQIKQNANRAAGLVRQLLAFSRRQTLRPEVMNVGEALSELTLLLKRLLGERVALELKHGREVWPVKADVNQFEQVIVNLAVNARDAMPEGGKLMIRTENVLDPGAASDAEGRGGAPAGDHVLIEVRDTGQGIPPELMEKIFEPFFTTKEIGKGTGLGLSTVFGIVKQSGGTIDVQSTIGEGTAFRIYLPRHVPVAEPEEVPAPTAVPALPRAEPLAPVSGSPRPAAEPGDAGAPRSAPAPATADKPAPRKPAADHTGQGTILLVEDEDPVRAVNSRALSARGYTVLEAASGLEALAIVREGTQPIDLVVSDVVMPEMDGPTLLREVRKHQPDLKVIFVSGYAEDAFRKNLPEGETFNFLPKPFSLKQLVETVKKTMAD